MPRDLFGSKFRNQLGYSYIDDFYESVNYKIYGGKDDRVSDKYREMLQMNRRGNTLEEELQRYGIRNYIIVGSVVNVNGNVELSGFGLDRIPFNFGKVTGNFKCSNNRITRLLGCPSEVGGEFDCSENLLTTLMCGPKVVKMDYVCERNQLQALQLGHTTIGGDLFASNNHISTLRHLPKQLDGMLYLGSLFAFSDYLTNSHHTYYTNSNNLVHINEMPEAFLHPLFESHIDIENVKMDCDLISMKRLWTLKNIIDGKL